jgi:[acyl-carrier-protein] S-malonyltransferase
MATPFSDTTIDVYANVTALPTRSADELRRLLIEQVCAPVLWTQTVLNMADNGINTFVEIGPGKVLQGLVKRTVEAEILGYDTEKDIQQLLA